MIELLKISECNGIFEAKLSKCDGAFVSLQGKGGKKMTVSEIKKDLGNKVSFGEVTTYGHFVCCQLLSYFVQNIDSLHGLLFVGRAMVWIVNSLL